MNVIKKLLFTIGIILSFTNTLLGTEVLAYYENDITPPWGRIYVEKSVPRDGISYVGSNTVTTRIYANDDICKDEEIKYYISTEEISDTSKLADNLWKTYKAGESTEITLDEDGTKKIYAIFKDANGNTSLIYEEDAENTQNIVFNANGGFGVPENINTTRVHGMSYILPTDAPYKRGYTFLGWSTDSKATVPSYREGDAVPPDASLGTEDETTLYAIYGTDLSTFPDLVDVVEVGDYVNYPVYYDNVVSNTWSDGTEEAKFTSKLNGWRVLSVDKGTGEVTLVSAGVPLTLFKSSAATAQTIASKMASSREFLNIGFTTNQTDGKLRKNGFTTYNSLAEAFTNKYTKITSDIPEVRAMTKADIDSIYQYFNETTEVTKNDNYLYDVKYRDMLAIPSTKELTTYYWCASNNGTSNLWFVSGSSAKLFNDGYGRELGVRPIVTLNSNVKAIGQNLNGAWDIGIEKSIVEKPTIGETKFLYNGSEKTLELDNVDSRFVTVVGTTSATEIDTYNVTISLKDDAKTTWTDGTTEPINIEWKISDLLVDFVDIGDYVNYPVTYDNVVTYVRANGVEGTVYNSSLNGWRVLSGDKEKGEVTLVSAGVPLTLFKSTANTSSTIAANMASTNNFLNIGFTTAQTDGKFRKSGFTRYGEGTEGLKTAFTNEFTKINSEIPEIRAMTKDDVDNVYQYFGGVGVTEDLTNVHDINFKDMLAIPATTSGYWSYYWLGTANEPHLWLISGEYGGVGCNSDDTERGVRVVVALNTNIKTTGTNSEGIWEIAN